MLLTEPIKVLVPPRFIIIAAERKYGTGSDLRSFATVIAAAAISSMAVESLRNMETAADTTQIKTKSLTGFPLENLTAHKAPNRNNPLFSATSTTIIVPRIRPISRMSIRSNA